MHVICANLSLTQNTRKANTSIKYSCFAVGVFRIFRAAIAETTMESPVSFSSKKITFVFCYPKQIIAGMYLSCFIDAFRLTWSIVMGTLLTGRSIVRPCRRDYLRISWSSVTHKCLSIATNEMWLDVKKEKMYHRGNGWPTSQVLWIRRSGNTNLNLTWFTELLILWEKGCFPTVGKLDNIIIQDTEQL